jgi:hypothetical protein
VTTMGPAGDSPFWGSDVECGAAVADEKLMVRVRALLAQAEHENTSRAEAEAFTAKAAELMARYGIDAAVLADRAHTRETVTSARVDFDDPYSREKANLLSTVARYSRCRNVWHGGSRTASHGTLFGFPTDLEHAQVLYTSLLLQATTGLLAAAVPRGHHVAAYRRSWLAGFTSGIADRLREAQRRAEEDARRAHESTVDKSTGAGADRSVALVLADRSAQVDAALHEAFPVLTEAQPRRLSGFGGFDGYDAGRRADIGGTRVATNSRRLLGNGAIGGGGR